MHTNTRSYSILDHILIQIDKAINTLQPKPRHSRPNPATSDDTPMTPSARKHAAGLMRVNHAGEVAAQGLYSGQALTAKNAAVCQQMQQSAAEEDDHLAWCEQRLDELHSHTSMLKPLWYGGSFCIGAIAGMAGDKWSLGFVAETERQVIQHLDRHLEQLPAADKRSREIIQQMKRDEAHHATVAVTFGAAELPSPIKTAMGWVSKVMTTSAYWF